MQWRSKAPVSASSKGDYNMKSWLIIAASVVGLIQHVYAASEQRETAMRLEILTDGMRAKCPAVQRAAPENANMTDAQIATYCGCMAKHLTQALTTDEALAMAAGQISHEVQIKLNALGITCAEVMNGQTKDGPITPVR
jgi:hypothetical protein